MISPDSGLDGYDVYGTPDSDDSTFWNGAIPWITPSEVTQLNSPYVATTRRMISELGLRRSSAELLPAQSLIVCTRATIGDCCINTVPMTTNQGFKSLVPDPKRVDVLCLHYWITFNKHLLLRLAGGSTFTEVPKPSFEGLEVRLPDLDEQRSIASVLIMTDNEIATLKDKAAALGKQKASLMQKLLTGELRCSE
jgi:type I restriction enzyme S subunit